MPVQWLVATEFGRTVAANGTGGTDHGTATAAIVLGGSVKGGRVLSDWPGLAPSNLFENRDLRPTLAINALISGAQANPLASNRDSCCAPSLPTPPPSSPWKASFEADSRQALPPTHLCCRIRQSPRGRRSLR